jgi:YVTN family beta-propeller protein
MRTYWFFRIACLLTLLMSLSCSSSSGPTNQPVLGDRVNLVGQPYGAAISSTGVAYITLGSAAKLARANLPSEAFVPAVNVGSAPSEVAFNSTSSLAYVTNQLSHTVGIVEVASNLQIDTIPVNGDPFEVIVQPGDSIIYVSTNVNRVYGIRLANKALVDSFPTPAIGNGMLIRDTLLYVSTHTGGTVIEFNLRTRAVTRTFTVGGTPQKMAISPDGQFLYIANQAGYVQFWNRITGVQIGGNLMLTGPGDLAYGIALRPTTGKLYVTTAYFGGGRVYVVDPSTRTIVDTVTAGGSTRRVVFDAHGVGFIPNEAGWVDFIN